MGNRKVFFCLFIILFFHFSLGFAEDYQLPYFLAKTSSKSLELTKKERGELLNRIEEVMERVREIREKLMRTIQEGDTDIRYQEGKFWMSKLEADQGSLDTGTEQLKSLRAKPLELVASVQLYKSLKDLSSNYNAYNNMPAFSRFVGDLAPEIDLWADPVFYQLYLLPLAKLRDTDKKPAQKEKKSDTRGKKS